MKVKNTGKIEGALEAIRSMIGAPVGYRPTFAEQSMIREMKKVAGLAEEIGRMMDQLQVHVRVIDNLRKSLPAERDSLSQYRTSDGVPVQILKSRSRTITLSGEVQNG